MSAYSGYTCPSCDSTEGTRLGLNGHPCCAACGYEDPYLLEQQRARIQRSYRRDDSQSPELTALEALRRASETKGEETAEK